MVPVASLLWTQFSGWLDLGGWIIQWFPIPADAHRSLSGANGENGSNAEECDITGILTLTSPTSIEFPRLLLAKEENRRNVAEKMPLWIMTIFANLAKLPLVAVFNLTLVYSLELFL